MELYATGLNAWGQLNFDKFENSEPGDLSHFTRILSDDKINAVYPHLSYTLVYVASGPISAGLVPPDHPPLTLLDNPSAPSHFAQSANGITTVNDAHAPLVHPHSNTAWLQLSKIFPHPTDITQLVAYDTGFAALTISGEVYTWGDERYAACLARDDSTPAHIPGLVTRLTDLPTGSITKIAAGGYVLAALTAGNDLYVWGHAGRAVAAGLSVGGIEITEDPTPILVEEHDIVDVAVGEAHLVVLTMTGDVFVIGSNGNGQLGLPGTMEVMMWTRVELPCPGSTSNRLVAVAAGPRNTFLLVGNKYPNR